MSLATSCSDKIYGHYITLTFDTIVINCHIVISERFWSSPESDVTDKSVRQRKISIDRSDDSTIRRSIVDNCHIRPKGRLAVECYKRIRVLPCDGIVHFNHSYLSIHNAFSIVC